MTTIAYKDGIVAWDSMLTRDNTIVSTRCEKMRIVKGGRFWFCGDFSDIENMALLLNNEPTSPKPIDGSAIYWDGMQIYHVGKDDRGIWKCVLDMREPQSIGSGSDHAITAMDCGKSARDAVKLAARRDTRTGGTIKTFKICEAF